MRWTHLALPLVALASALAPCPARAEDPPATPAAPEAPKRKTLTDKERAEVLPLFKQYLEPDSELGFKHRMNLLIRLKAYKDAGTDVFADVEGLRTLLYGSRPFKPVFEKRSIPKEAKGAEIVLDTASNVTNVAWDDLRLSVALPPAYTAAREAKKLNAIAPFPMLVTLHELIDFQDAKGSRPYPGMEVLKRRWDRRGPLKAVPEGWILFAPVATRARFVEEGQVKSERVPLNAVWQRYPVDVNRIVIEGGSDALLFAASYPNFYAGVVVRGETADIDPDEVCNLAGMPVFVVKEKDKEPPAVASLAKGGHPADRITVGPVERLPEWLGAVRRTIPKAFKWVCKDRSAQRLAHWINLDILDEPPVVPTVEVEIVDTPDDPNTLRLKTRGVRSLTLFLSDQLVDLDRPVRVVVNGKPAPDARIASNAPEGKLVTLPAKFDRTLDAMLDRKGLSIRRSLYFGWMFPVVLEGIQIRGDYVEPGDAPPVTTDTAGSSDKELGEEKAKTYLEKATEHEKAGRLATARGLYEKIVALGDTTIKAQAEAKVKELEGKADTAGAPK